MIAPPLKEIDGAMSGPGKSQEAQLESRNRGEVRHHADPDGGCCSRTASLLASDRWRPEAEAGAVDHRVGITASGKSLMYGELCDRASSR